VNRAYDPIQELEDNLVIYEKKSTSKLRLERNKTLSTFIKFTDSVYYKQLLKGFFNDEEKKYKNLVPKSCEIILRNDEEKNILGFLVDFLKNYPEDTYLEVIVNNQSIKKRKASYKAGGFICYLEYILTSTQRYMLLDSCLFTKLLLSYDTSSQLW